MPAAAFCAKWGDARAVSPQDRDLARARSGRSRAPPSVRGVPCARMEGKDEHKDEGEAPLDAEVDEEPAIIDWPAALEQVIGCSPPLARAHG